MKDNNKKKKKFKINGQKIAIIFMLIATIALFISSIVSGLVQAG